MIEKNNLKLKQKLAKNAIGVRKFNWPAIDDVDAPSQAWEFSSNLACNKENL